MRRYGEFEFLGLSPDGLIVAENPPSGGEIALAFDSSGPIFWTDPATGERIVVALFGGWGAGYRRVDTPEVLAFLESVIAAVEAGQF